MKISTSVIQVGALPTKTKKGKKKKKEHKMHKSSSKVGLVLVPKLK